MACPRVGPCTVGRRLSKRTLLSGALWSVLDSVEPLLEYKLQRIECKNEGGATLIGIDIPTDKVDAVQEILAANGDENDVEMREVDVA